MPAALRAAIPPLLACVALAACVAVLAAWAPMTHARAKPNEDEAAVRPYTLPDVLAGPDGKPAASAEDWRARCRP